MIHGFQHRQICLGYSIATWCAILFALGALNVDAPIMALPPPARATWSGASDAHQVSLGQSIDEVIAILGQPDQIVDLGSRVIYVYKGRKVFSHSGRIFESKGRKIVFTDGRVTDLGTETAQPSEFTKDISEPRTLQGNGGGVISVAFSSDGRTLASGGRNSTTKLWDVVSGQLLHTLQGNTLSAYSVAFSPDGRTLALGSHDDTIKLLDVASGKLLHTLQGHTHWVMSVAFSPDGHTVASGNFDGTIKLWDVVSGQVLHNLQNDITSVYSVAFSPDGRTLASGSFHHDVKLWDVASGQLLRTLYGHTSTYYLRSVAFSPDGRTVASGSDDTTIKLWDVASGVVLRTLQGHTNAVDSVAFSPDGRTLASGSRDRTIKLWDVASGKVLRTLQGHANWVHSVAFSPDGRTLASGSYDDTVKLWDITDIGIGKTTENAKQEPADSIYLFQDDFSRDAVLNDKLWRTDTALLRSVAGIASSPGSAWIEPKLSFTSAGMRMSGITGTYQITGIQSNKSFKAPFTLKATAEGTISHGNPFVVFLVSSDLRQLVSITGTLNASTGYQGVWETVRTNGQSKSAEKIYETPTTGIWYNVGITIDGSGNASVTFLTADGKQLASNRIAGLGKGPFYVILAQREGLPYSVGANEAIWRQVSLSRTIGSGGAVASGEQQSGKGGTVEAGPSCLGSGDPGVRNDIHGAIRILGGSGAFAGMSSSNKVLTVHPGSQLVGSVHLHVVNGGSPDAVAPLIGTVSWGDPSHAFWTVASWIHTGEQSLDAQVRITVPDTPGTYHILFAMQLELSGSNVASGTNWAIHNDTWGDGNDIAQFNPMQIAHAQQDGCAVGQWLTARGYEPMAVPADAITLNVR